MPSLIHLLDCIFFSYMALSSMYILIFAIASQKKHKSLQHIPATEHSPFHTFLVLFPAYQEDAVIRHSIDSFLQQDYPRHLYQVAVISDHMEPETNTWLASQPIILHQPTFEKSSKAQALQYAVAHTKENFTHVVILDADNVVDSHFLAYLNAVCSQSHRAIQCHRTAKNADSDIAMLDGVSEEINNSIFRKGHNGLGLSSALIGSGMCFDYDWFASNVHYLHTAGEDRELEMLLMQQNIFIKYEEFISVMDEKVSTADNFQRQRLRWMTAQVQSLLSMLPYLPTALRQGNVNYIDKTLQQALIPRSILLVGTTVIALCLLLIAPSYSIKWWGLLALIILALYLAIPSRLRTRSLLSPILLVPSLVWRMLKNMIHINHHDTQFIHTTHNK